MLLLLARSGGMMRKKGYSTTLELGCMYISAPPHSYHNVSRQGGSAVHPRLRALCCLHQEACSQSVHGIHEQSSGLSDQVPRILGILPLVGVSWRLGKQLYTQRTVMFL